MSNRLVKTPDTAYIASLTKNGYGDESVDSLNEIKCAFFQQFSQEQPDNEELTQSDAYAYLDISNEFIKGLGYQLQGLYFKISLFGADQWYIITTVQVAQRKLLTNEVNNVLVNLQVVAAPAGGN
jgi:hypothetical protein